MSEEIDRNAIIREFTEVVGEHFVKLFKLLQLETHIEVMLRNDPTNEEWILSLKKIPHYLKDLDRDKKIESQSDELRQLREKLSNTDAKYRTLLDETSDERVEKIKIIQSLTAEVERLTKEKNDLGVKFDKELERWQERDMNELNKRIDLEAKVEKLKGLLEQLIEIIERAGNPSSFAFPSSMIPTIIREAKRITEIESTLNPGER